MKFSIPDSIPRAALITGGARQRAMVHALTEAGFAVALQSHAAIEEELPPGTVVLPADLSDEAQTSALLARATEAVGPIGVLINAATTIEHDTWDDATRATWDMHIETNLYAPFVLIQRFARALPASSSGVVINLLDQRISQHLVSYTLSKAALWTLTQTMALALAPRIRVNGIALGRAPQGAMGDEVARAAIAILALESMTGQMIVPDGVPDAAPDDDAQGDTPGSGA
jgi:NAD(P)-dependent dehydrogenase (short-subunit alcohol dehydrogenase family)